MVADMGFVEHVDFTAEFFIALFNYRGVFPDRNDIIHIADNVN
jgi:hypothetical protein